MPRTIVTLFALATLSAAAPLMAQSAYSAGPGTPDSTLADPNSAGSSSIQETAAPIERNVAPENNGYPQAQQPQQGYANQQPNSQPNTQPSAQQRPANQTTEPTHGVWLVSAPDASVQTVSATPDLAELRVDHGRVNVNVYHPAEHARILVDLPGGQVSLVKDGLYTFNAENNTVRVLHGEAEISENGAKAIKIKEDHEFVFGTEVKAQDVDPNVLRTDLLQGNYGEGSGYRHGDGFAPYGYGYAPYAYGWPYYGFYGPGFGYPYAFGGPFGYGYPYGFGVGVGVGYYGGFGGFRGGYGGFRGGYGGFRR